jgi:hypothetical protein
VTSRQSILVASLFLFAYPSASNPLHAVQSRPTGSQTAASIQLIRQQYAAINKGVRRYKKVTKELSGFSLEGGELFAYFDGPAIVKIVANYFGESGRASEEYYYRNGKLIFVFRRDHSYDRPLSGKVVSTRESRFYFQNDGLVRWINETGKPVPPGMAEFPLKEDEYRETSRKLLDGARSNNAIIEADE